MLLASGVIGAGQDVWSGRKGPWGWILWQLGQAGGGCKGVLGPCTSPHPVAGCWSCSRPDPLGMDYGAKRQGGGLGQMGRLWHRAMLVHPRRGATQGGGWGRAAPAAAMLNIVSAGPLQTSSWGF